MVKHLRHAVKLVKLLLLFALLLLIGLAIWLHADQRSLNFAKPWITGAINTPDAAYAVTIGDVSIDWRNAVELGEVRIANVTFAKRDGSVFAQLPEVYVTIDPIGFLPTRHMLHTVTLHGPRLFVTRTGEGDVELGLEGSTSRMALNGLVPATPGAAQDDAITLPELPFHDFIIDGAELTFSDVKSDTKIVSTPMALHMVRHGHYFDATLSMPFMLDEKPVHMEASLVTRRDGRDHVFTLKAQQFPAQFVCMFAACPEKVGAVGLLDGMVAQRVDADNKPGVLKLMLGTKDATLTAPAWFQEPLTFGQSTVNGEIDWNGPRFNLTSAKLALEDTSITAAGEVHKAEDGWYAKLNGDATQLDVKKIYKYWPLFLAPDSRAWVVSKLKSGYAASGKLKIDFKPSDITSTDGVSDASVDAVADARDITFEYLPGFPLVEKMSGIAHFTGKTVRVEGGGGTILSGTKIGKAMLWCPQLDNPKNPMEATVEAVAPASDAATLLALKYFTFDDGIKLDPKTISGTVDATMKLKFNAFSDKPGADPSEIHLDGVTYDIATTLTNVAQDKLGGGYNAKAINGDLKATNAGMSFKGSVALADTGTSDITLAQEDGKPMTVSVKSREGGKDAARNDFNLVYQSGSDGPKVSITGKRLDGSVSYGTSDNSLLKNFPALHLDLALDELLLADDTPFTAVTAKLDCSTALCESADFKAKVGNSLVRGGIARNGGARRLTVNASDAGSFVKALDISDRMTRGKLSLNGTFDDSKTPPEMKGRLLISDFTLKNSQILGRILSIGSLTGLSNALTGSGISFDKLNADITSRGGLITIGKGVANGTAIGITVGGTIDTNTTKLGLKGVVVPAYALNSIIGKIPLIGALAGGEGEGLIAFNYWVNGTYEKPDVGVNPLSGLTPGFLRGVFSIFDEKTPAKKDDDTSSTPAAPKKAPSGTQYAPMRRK